MSKSEKVKEEIGWLKVVFAIFVGTDISLVAWFVQNYSSRPTLLIVICLVAVVLITGILIWINYAAYKKIDELEDL
jgi:cytochrome b subunit of formate dehydrogenase